MKNFGLYMAAILLALALGAFTSSSRTAIIAEGINQGTMENDYKKEWQEIAELESKGLVKSAYEKVVALYSRAKQENNDPQIIKTILYRERYGSQLEEYGFENSVRTFQTELEFLDGPAKSILHFMIGKSLTNYLQANFWKFNNRTSTPNFKPEELETWSIQHFMDEIDKQFSLALEDESLKKSNVEFYDAITIRGQNTDHLRPTVFDLVAHQILDYYINPNAYLTEPVYKFYLDEEVVFSPSKDFVEHKFSSQDSTSRLLIATRIFQNLLAHQINNGNRAALVDADLKRLQFALNNATTNEKGQKYLAALNNLAEKNKRYSDAMPMIMMAQAQFYAQSKEHLKDEKSNIKQAQTVWNNLVNEYPNSREAKEAKNMIISVSTSSLNLELEKVYPIGETMLSKITYKNIDKVFLRLYKIDPIEEFVLQSRGESFIKGFVKREVTKSWTQNLPRFDDFHEYSTEIAIPNQSVGKYVLLASTDESFKEGKANITINYFAVSNLSFVYDAQNPHHQIIVVDRISGKPIKGATASFYKRVYNPTKRENEIRLEASGESDENGIVKVKLTKNKSYIPKVEFNEDLLFLNDWVRQDKQRKNSDRNRVNIFLDRAIYRPGQTIYFKAIAYNIDGETQIPELLTDQKLKAIFKDANYQEVENLTLTTNDYGSIHGSFTAPSSGLLGRMTIQIEGFGNTNFSVEEYKRPKFEAEILPIAAEYALNESVTVSGKATSFAGNAIDDAKVSYRVERGVEYPYWRSYYRWYRPSASTRIKTGETETKPDGTFDIEFDLLPDPSTRQKDQPVYVYSVFADITDISGETRSVQTRLKASNIALDLQLVAQSPVETDSLKEVYVYSNNLVGKFQPTEVTLKIESLKPESRLYRDRYWAFPDTVSFSTSQFERQFPEYRFSKKKQVLELDVDKVVFEKTIKTSEKGEVDLSKLKLNAGLYKITAITQDKNGNELAKEISLQVTNQNAKAPAFPTGLTLSQDRLSYEPGEIVDLNISSSIKDVSMFFSTLRRDKSRTHTWFNFSGRQNEKLSVTEKDRGNIVLTGFVVSNNRFYAMNNAVIVPWSNKNLKISYSTFRDNLLPGQEEEWIIKVEGNKKEKVTAEILAGMYDASLDQFRPNGWSAPSFPSLYGNSRLGAGTNFTASRSGAISFENQTFYNVDPKVYRQFDWLGFSVHNYSYAVPTRSINELASKSTGFGGRKQKRMMQSAPSAEMDEVVVQNMDSANEVSYQIDGVRVSGDLLPGSELESTKSAQSENAPQVRRNLNETVFFFPDLQTDKEGNVLIKFKMNEALTKWKFMAFAHTKDMASAISTKEIVTQKELMVQPNAPRFFREGDKIRYVAKVSNLTEKKMTGMARLELYDAITNESLDISYANDKNEQVFTIKPGESSPLFWDLLIPNDKLGTVLHRVVAEAGEYADGEESAVPVLTNRKLVTETMPMPLRVGESKDFVFQTMRDNTWTTLTNHAFTLEFTSNPAWYAVQSLPYLMEYPYKCTEQIFNKYYANALATHVANSTPKIKQIFAAWKGTDAIQSNLSKNQELKSALLEETPWVLDAQTEEQQRKNIALLFDLNKMSHEKAQSLKTLSERQLSNGGFAWFPGGQDSWYITQYLVEGIGHLQRLGVDVGDQDLSLVLEKAIHYMDERLVAYYNRYKKYNNKPGLSGRVIHYLYARSFFMDQALEGEAKNVVRYYQGLIADHWVKQGLYYQGMLALASHRMDMSNEANEIVSSLKERALSHEELGMYWKYDRGYFWHQMPIETHALMIEVFEEVAKDKPMVDELRLWLLKNKQTNAWETTKATAAAVYALLMSGDSWLKETKQVEIIFPNKGLNAEMAKSQANAEAGTGYFKHRFEKVNPNLSSVKVINPNTVPAWGAAYWQYFEDLDKITDFGETPLKLNKKVFKENQGDRGATMEEVAAGSKLEVGDKLTIRIELRVDRDMEFIHMKDMRASGFEPMNVFSQYKWQGGLGYYESTRDASTNFFFDQLPKGTYVFEYPVRVVHQGDFSNGVTTIQSMYAPEFASHSKGGRISVGE